MANLDGVLKSKDITLPTKVCLSTKELMFLNCGVWEDPWESLGQQGDQISQS